MKHTLLLSFLVSVSLLGSSCKKEPKYSKEELYLIAYAADPSVSFVLPKSPTDGIQCSDYTEGCVGGHTVEVQKLRLIAVEFTNEAQAIYAAKKVRGYYVRNWLFDDVTGEPKLEKFVVQSLGAKKP